MKNSKDNKSVAVIEKSDKKENYMLPIEEESLRLLQITEETRDKMEEYYIRILEDDEAEAEAEDKTNSLRRAAVNITKALTQTYAVTDELSSRWNDIKKQKKKKFIAPAPANAAIDLKEEKSEHFAKGLNIYKLLLICYCGSFLGVVIELIYCLVTKGYLESRSGLVYGPFNLLYGAGAVALTVCLFKLRNHAGWLSFFGGMIIGSAVEYICSWGQEVIFGTRSWDYSRMPFNINGRICLLYSVFWGFLGVLWIKNLYPRIAKHILKIPNHIGKIVTWTLAVFFVVNAFMSSVAMYRWTERAKGVNPSNGFWEFIDERFPDERMEGVYANIKMND